MASLHAGCLLLAVETGRYRIPTVPLGERACKLCNNGKVKTEFHLYEYVCTENPPFSFDLAIRLP